VATSTVLEDKRHMGNATCPDFKVWPQNLKMIRKSKNFDLRKTKNKEGKGHL